MAVPGFSQMKDLYRMQKEAKEMQKKMEQIVIKGHSKDELVSVTLDGTQALIALKIDDSLLITGNSKKIEESIKQAYKDAQKKLQKEMMKGMDINQLKGMLGG